MNLLVKIYKKRYDRHNETLWTTDFFNSVFCLVSCSSKIKFHISKLWTTQIWYVCYSEKTTKKKKPNKQTNKQKKLLKKCIKVRSSNLSRVLRHSIYFFSLKKSQINAFSYAKIKFLWRLQSSRSRNKWISQRKISLWYLLRPHSSPQLTFL